LFESPSAAEVLHFGGGCNQKVLAGERREGHCRSTVDKGLALLTNAEPMLWIRGKRAPARWNASHKINE
jgi:hypothetical protein